MSERTGLKIFVTLFFIVFVAAVHGLTGWRLDDVTMASAPIFLAAEAFVFAMVYMTIFHSHVH